MKNCASVWLVNYFFFFTTAQGQVSSGSSLKISLPPAPAEIIQVDAKLTRQGYKSIRRSIRVQQGSSAEITFPRARAGQWDLFVEAKNRNNIARFSGSKVVKISAGESITVEIDLQPLDGELSVAARWSTISAQAVYLSDMKEDAVFNIMGGLGRDSTYWGGPLTVNGVKYKKAVVTHPDAGEGFVEYRLQKRYSKFTAMIAILDDSYASGDSHGNGRFFVETDGNRVFESPVLRWNGVQSMDVEVDVKGVEILRLCVDNGNGINWSDHAAWINARLEPRRH